jgi:hypothetical protein
MANDKNWGPRILTKSKPVVSLKSFNEFPKAKIKESFEKR